MQVLRAMVKANDLRIISHFTIVQSTCIHIVTCSQHQLLSTPLVLFTAHALVRSANSVNCSWL